MASVKTDFDDATVPFGESAVLRVCPYGFQALRVVLTLPEPAAASGSGRVARHASA